jgi:hypothetical protein
MTEEKKTGSGPGASHRREAQADQKVGLDEIVFDTERYCHRDPEALGYENLESLMDSLTQGGKQVPVEFFVNAQGQES